MVKKYRICVITGTRAEYGLLRRCLFLLQNHPNVDMMLVVTGTHLIETFGNTQQEIRDDGFSYVSIPIPMEDDSKAGMAISAGVAMQRFAELFQEDRPDLILILGDRFEIFSAASAAHLMGIPIAHISGGDVTEGAIDDAVRHSITKMSTLHFPGCEQSAKRIIQMGEQPDMVFNVGDPGVENCLCMKKMPRKELAENLGFSQIMGDYNVVTFHPVTMESDTAEKQVRELICAMDAEDRMAYIVTLSNADAGGRRINEIWRTEEKSHPNWLVISSLGVLRYLSAVQYAKLVIGNSSSGIYEAPALGTPTINIGDRQKGRMMADSVLTVSPEASAICEAMHRAMGPGFREIVRKAHSPFGNGTTSEQIVRIVLKYLDGDHTHMQKSFYDIDFTL